MSKSDFLIIFIAIVIGYIVAMFTVTYPVHDCYYKNGIKQVPENCRRVNNEVISCIDFSSPMPKWLLWSFAEYLHKNHLDK